ncbi:MAG: PAS domain S-box protein [Fimbriimonadales bacterium]|nr:MAG: hypothetical protein KatS3mg018_0311 [Fimbriimonadales bacterium]
MAEGREPFATILLRIVFTALAYIGLAQVSLRLAVLPDGSSLLWLPTGAALGFTYWWGHRAGLAGTMLGVSYVVWARWGKWDLALISALIVCTGIALIIFLLRAWRLNPRFESLQDVLKLLGAGALVGGLTNTLNVLLRVSYGVISPDNWGTVTLYRWMGDWLGYLLVGSFLLIWWGNWQMRKRDYGMLVVLSCATFVVGWLTFYLQKAAGLPAPSLLLLFPLLVAGAFLYQQRGVSLLELTASISLAIFAHGDNPSAPLEFKQAIFGWLFLVLTFCTLMAVAVAVTQQRAYALQLEQSRQELERAYQQVRNILENAPTVAMQMYDHQGRILFWNHASEQFYGYSAQDAEGKTLDALIFTPDEQQEFLEKLQQVRTTGQPAPLQEWKVRTADGTERVILSSLFPIQYEGETRYICADIDITERKALERRLFQAEKLESIGRLAGGVAHDFNNLLTAILGFAELAQSRLPHDHPVQQDIERIVQSSLRAANLVRQLLGYARKQLTQPRPVSMNAVIQELLPLLENILDKEITIRLHLTEQENTVFIDPAQLEQIVMNLTLNARDAMRNKENGVLTIAVERRFCSEKELPADAYEEPRAGEYVCLIVRDTGEGIPESARAHIFEPFFSTKGLGNTGLGLATVYGIVRQNGGFITVESEEGKGATFIICLPPWDGQVQSHADDPSRTPSDAGNH